MSSPSPGSISAPSSANPGTAYQFRVNPGGFDDFGSSGNPAWAVDIVLELGGITTVLRSNIASSTNYNITIPYSVLQGMPTSTSKSGVVKLLRGGVPMLGYGSASVTIKTKSDANTIPEISDVTFEDKRLGFLALGGFLQDVSSIATTISSSAKHGATITSSSLTFDGLGHPMNQDYKPTVPGTIAVLATIRDSRGYTATKQVDLEIRAYSPPEIDGLNVQRIDGSGNPNPKGESVRVLFEAKVQSFKDGSTEKNETRCDVLTRAVGASDWVLAYQSTVANSTNSIDTTLPGVYNNQKTYEVWVFVQDVTDTTTQIYTRIATDAVTYDLNGTNVGIGKYWERGTLDVGGDVYADRYFDQSGGGGLVPTGTIVDFAGSSAPDGWLLCDGSIYPIEEYQALYEVIGFTYSAYAGEHFAVPDTRERVRAGYSEGSSEFGDIGKTGGTKTHTLTTSQIPNLTAQSGGAHGHGIAGFGRIVTTNRATDFSDRTAPSASGGAASVPAYGGNGTQAMGSEPSVSSGGSHSHVVNSGGGGSHPILQPYITFNTIIKA